MLTLNEQEEKAIDKIVSAIADYIQIEPIQVAPPLLSYPFRDWKSDNTNGGYLGTERT